MKKKEIFRCRKTERGAAMLESLLAILLLMLVLFGLLHVIYFYIGQYFTEYAAIRGARSSAVGFTDYISNLEARIHAIGASGKMVIPNDENNPTDENGNPVKLQYASSNMTREKTLIERYMTGYTYIEYKNWNGYQGGKYVKDEERGGYKKVYEKEGQSQTYFRTSINKTENDMLSFTATFENYTFFENFTRYLFFSKNINLTARAKLADHSCVFLDK